MLCLIVFFFRERVRTWMLQAFNVVIFPFEWFCQFSHFFCLLMFTYNLLNEERLCFKIGFHFFIDKPLNKKLSNQNLYLTFLMGKQKFKFTI